MIRRNRVGITGLGVLAANGIGKEAFWNSLLAGESGIGPITFFDATDFKSQIAGEILDFVPENYMNGRVKARRLSRNVQLGIKAALLAIEDAEITSDMLRRAAPIPIILSSSLGGFDHIENQILRVAELGPNKLLPYAVEGCIHLAAASLLGAILDIPTELNTISNSCVGGIDAIAQGAKLIQDGKADIVICGGTDAPIVPSALAGFCAAGMVSTNNHAPKHASRPFDASRDGGVLAEGSGVVVLESLGHAQMRNKTPYAEILGYGTARDLNNGRPGNGLLLCMKKALANARLTPANIHAINAHGSSDIILDITETLMLMELFGDHIFNVPVSSIKGSTGNPLAAGGVHQVIASSLSLIHNRIPPTANHTIPDIDCILDYVPFEPRLVDIDKILINSHGSGAMNSTLIIGGVGQK